jgi:iron complex transport system ATP-binding protein
MSLAVENVTFSYGERRVVDQCSFSLPRGQVVCLLGRNGSGKTTLLRLANRSLQPKEGRITIDGTDIRSFTRKHLARLIAFVPQGHNAVFAYTARDMTVMGRNPHMSLFARPTQQDYQLAEEAMRQVGIYELKDRCYMDMSGGERQLVFLARALAQQASYYLLDEPTAHLDFYNQHALMKTLRKIVEQQGCGALIALHDPNLAFCYADQVIMLRQGRIVNVGSVADTMTSSNLSHLYNMQLKVVSLDGQNMVMAK